MDKEYSKKLEIHTEQTDDDTIIISVGRLVDKDTPCTKEPDPCTKTADDAEVEDKCQKCCEKCECEDCEDDDDNDVLCDLDELSTREIVSLLFCTMANLEHCFLNLLEQIDDCSVNCGQMINACTAISKSANKDIKRSLKKSIKKQTNKSIKPLIKEIESLKADIAAINAKLNG